MARTLTARSTNAEAYVPPAFHGADSWVDERVAIAIDFQLFAKRSTLLDELLLVPVPVVDVPAPVPVPVVAPVGGRAPVPVVLGPEEAVGDVHFVGAVPFVGFAGFEPVSGEEAVVVPDGRRVHPF